MEVFSLKVRFTLILSLLLFLLSAPALAAKAPAVEMLGSEKAAEHLVTHVYAYTDYWDGYNPSACTDEGCADYGHVHCYGRQVTLWDTPNKGSSRVAYYPFGTDGKVGPGSEFQLIDVVTYRGKFYANIRILKDGYAVNSGFINADYVGCDCETYEGFEPVPEYVHDHGPFSLK